MEDKKTIKYLNNKIWYRAIKIVYIFSFFVVLAFMIVAFSEGEFTVLDVPNSKVICQYGNEKQSLMKDIFSKDKMPVFLPNYYNLRDDEFSQAILKSCSIDKVIDQGPSKRFLDSVVMPGESQVDFIPDPYRIEEEEKIQFGYTLLVLLVTIVIFEVIRRIFYYIVLGIVKPKK
tara:strand:- start:431 stop:952 length:522 start_codon:yes stop_codon:yes gene_type:complete